MGSRAGSSRVKCLNSTKQSHSFVRSTVTTTGKPVFGSLSSSKRIEPVRHRPFRKLRVRPLMLSTYEAVLSAVAVPPCRPEPKPPTAFLRARDFAKRSAELGPLARKALKHL